ncbi:Ig-like domain-containing protein [Curtobacterium ammoniigenes]|uniref:Ig-like domain-containing protein n=1 Tax=Curtobacterium ammoniigenes TaxID=395387 RepID=UPI000ABB7F97|nr:Ig-like domain-containing protein [Curtobacterium ammoniigenes]
MSDARSFAAVQYDRNAQTGLPANADPASALQIFIDGTLSCTTTVSAPSCQSPSGLAAGAHSVTVAWSGDSNYTSATSASVRLTVTVADVTVSATADGVTHDTIVHGDSAVLSTLGIPSDATGTVRFTTSAGATLCTVDLTSSTTGSCDTASVLAAGVYTVTATYSGDSNYAAAVANAIQLTVAKAQPALTATVDGAQTASVSYGAVATLAVTNLPADATRTIDYTDASGDILCTATVRIAGDSTACDSSSSLPAGSYAIAATYEGDANNAPYTTAGQITLNVGRAATSVQAAASGSATSAATSSPLTVGHGTAVTFTAANLPVGATGTVVFRSADGTILYTIELALAPSCQTNTTVPGGTYAVTPTYSGDANYAGSAGSPIRLTVTPQRFVLQVRTSATTGTWGDTATLSATGIPADATGSVQFSANGRVLCTAELPSLTCATDAIEPGLTTITALYSGDESYDTATATGPITVTAASITNTTPIAGSSQTTLTARWSAVHGAAGYRILVSTSKNLGSLVAGAPFEATAASTSWVVTGLLPGVTYYYQVIAVAPDGTTLPRTTAWVRRSRRVRWPSREADRSASGSLSVSAFRARVSCCLSTNAGGALAEVCEAPGAARTVRPTRPARGRVASAWCRIRSAGFRPSRRK